MRTVVSFALGIIAVAVALPLTAAASQRTFVASYGVDGGNLTCSLANPCRTFNTAIGNTNPGGEVVILDTAGYGPMTITKSIKIIGPSGVYGGISVVGGGSGITTGIVINAADTDEITLRGLDVSGVPGVAPFPDIGIDIQSASAVHIEKSSIANFAQDTSACVKVSVATTTRVYVVDSFLRECRNGVYANGAVAVANRPSVMIDNTRIERGKNTSVSPVSTGVLMQGFIDVSLRNSMISRQTVGVQFDGLLANNVSHLEIINGELTRNNTGVAFSNTTANARGQITLTGSQIFGSTDAITVANSGIGGSPQLLLVDTTIAYTSNSGVVLANSAADNNTYIHAEMNRSQINNITATALDISATNGSKLDVILRDSQLAQAATGLKTSGSGAGGYAAASLVQSTVTGTTTAIDHGFGTVRLQSSHIVFNNKDFVNSGSGTIVSNGQNMVHDNADPAGPTYITPTVIPLK